jgi:hypothetical protein
VSSPPTLDLVILVPGNNEREVFDSLLARAEALQIRRIRYDIKVHPGRDPGCFHRPAEILVTYSRTTEHALVVFDHAGSGQEHRRPEELEEECQSRLAATGWGQRAAVLVIAPELEAWVWSGSPHVAKALGWRGRTPELRSWLCDRGLWPTDDPKPPDPKSAVEAALAEIRLPRSSAIYGHLAMTVSLQQCQDVSFSRFRHILRGWFSP